MKLVIDRQIWLRGEDSEKSYLRRKSDGKQCCIGIYCSALGIPETQLTGNKDATRVKNKFLIPEWLFSNKFRMFSSGDANRAYQINDAIADSDSELKGDDNIVTSELEREQRITEIFARNGIEVEFVG